MIYSLSLSRVLPSFVIGICLLSMSVFFVLSYFILRGSIEEKSNVILESLLKTNVEATNAVFSDLRDELVYQAGTPAIIKAMIDLQSGWSDSDPQSIKEIFLADVEDRSEISMGDGEEIYEFMHEGHHAGLLSYVKKSMFDDIYLITNERQIIYSARKSDAFGLNLNDQKGAGAFFATLANTINELERVKDVQTNFVSEASDGQLATFFATKIVSEGEELGFVVGKLNAEKTGDNFQTLGMIGQTGLITMISRDGTAISGMGLGHANQLPDYNFKTTALNGIALHSASTAAGPQVTFATLSLGGGLNDYLLVVQQANSEVFSDLTELVWFLAIAAGAVMAVVTLVGFFGVKIISRPLSAASNAIQNLADGEIEDTVKVQTIFREIQMIAAALASFRDNAQEKKRLEVLAKTERDLEIQKANKLSHAIDQFKKEISEILSTLSTETRSMKGSANVLSKVVDLATEEGKSAIQSTTKASQTTSSISEASTDMSSAIREIASQTQQAGNQTEETSKTVNEASKIMDELGQSVGKIGEIVDLIRKISHESKMLAMNARVESARAGVAGRNFSVIADEVKSLSVQTSNATDDVESQINRVQEASNQAAEAFKIVAQAMLDIDRTTRTIVLEVDKQETRSVEIAQNIDTTASESSQALSNVETVASAIEDTDEQVRQVSQISGSIADVSERLSQSVDNFLAEVHEVGAKSRAA